MLRTEPNGEGWSGGGARASRTARVAARVCLVWAVAVSLAGALAEEEGVAFFERRVRPLLLDHCAECHGPEKQKGHLRLDTPEWIRTGGESGSVIGPGGVENSRLIRAVGHEDPDLRMPPKRRLTEHQIQILRAWVGQGAPMPAGAPAAARVETPPPAGASRSGHWAFQPVARPVIPSGLAGSRGAENPVDAFVREELAARGLRPNGEATKRELARRVWFDLIGLPPTPEAVREYELDPAPDAYERLVDRLLASPRYGERWARHWLDVARFAQSNGYERDGEKALAWRYRDYVVRAFNQDLPYGRFVMEQIAGDELPDATAESVVATGFLRLGVHDDEPDDKRMAEFDALDDVLSATGASILGLTVGCARCHDHKFDPLSQADYYSLLSFFRGVRPHENNALTLDSASYLPLEVPSKARAWIADRAARLGALQSELAAAQEAGSKQAILKRMQALTNRVPFEWALGVRESGPTPPPTHVLIRGNAATPSTEVQPAIPAMLGGRGAVRVTPPAGGSSSGRRLAFAEWLASPANPLTARVVVNRVWHQHFGQGLVRTTTDFGRAGTPPTHPRLLDWLAADFMDSGWSLKRLHRRILLSQTYRQSSSTANARGQSIDPGNEWLWRQNLRRLEAEPVRDSVLAVSGDLNGAMGGRGFFPQLSGEVLGGQSRPGLDWEVSKEPELARRSIYAFVRRTMLTPMLDYFDYSNTTGPLGERPVTTVAPQALMLWNDDFMRAQARSFATRLEREAGSTPERWVQRAYELALSRSPSARERSIALAFLRRQSAGFSTAPTRIAFRPEVPAALSSDYFGKLATRRFLAGPETGWGYHRGFWEREYEGIRAVDRTRTPFALWLDGPVSPASAACVLTVPRTTELGSLLFGASAVGDQLRGYEIELDPRAKQVRLSRHDGKDAPVLMGEAAVDLPPAAGVAVRVERTGGRLKVFLGGASDPVLDATDPDPLESGGRVGFRAWGGAIIVERLEVGWGGSELRPAGAGASAMRRALESFCLLVFNLNEMVYID